MEADRRVVGVQSVIERHGTSRFEERLAESSRLTSPAEFEELLRTPDRAVRGVAYRLVGDDVDDVLQAAYMKAFEQRASFRGESSNPRSRSTAVMARSAALEQL